MIKKRVSGLPWPAPSSSLPPPSDGNPKSTRSRSALPSSPLTIGGLGDGSSEYWNRSPTPFFGVSQNLCLEDSITF